MLTAAHFDANCDTSWCPQLAARVTRGSCSHHLWPLAAACGQGPPSFFCLFFHAQDDKVPGVLTCAPLSSLRAMHVLTVAAVEFLVLEAVLKGTTCTVQMVTQYETGTVTLCCAQSCRCILGRHCEKKCKYRSRWIRNCVALVCEATGVFSPCFLIFN